MLTGLALSLWIGAPALAQSSATGSALALTADQADAIGVDAYVYFYPLILMDLTRKQSINGTRTVFGQGPMNTFASVPAYPPADFKGVVRSNFDTLYSIAWLDLTHGPVVVSAPNTEGRYYLLPMLECGPTSLRRPAGGRPALRRAISWSLHLAGADMFLKASRASTRQLRMFGSSAAPRPTDRQTTTLCTKFRRATKSRRFHSGANHPSLGIE